MPPFATALLLLIPRAAVAVLWFGTTFFSGVFRSAHWPLLGAVFAPLTTLAYSWMVRTHQHRDSMFFVLLVVAFLLDFSFLGMNQKREPATRAPRRSVLEP